MHQSVAPVVPVLGGLIFIQQETSDGYRWQDPMVLWQ
jgi:hypothetical protein